MECHKIALIEGPSKKSMFVLLQKVNRIAPLALAFSEYSYFRDMNISTTLMLFSLYKVAVSVQMALIYCAL